MVEQVQPQHQAAQQALAYRRQQAGSAVLMHQHRHQFQHQPQVALAEAGLEAYLARQASAHQLQQQQAVKR